MLEVEFEKLQKVHEETERLINETENISGTLLSEYRRGVEQYKSMYSSMELFKKDCSGNSMANFIWICSSCASCCVIFYSAW